MKSSTTENETSRYRFTTAQLIDLKYEPAVVTSPSVGSSSAQASVIYVKFMNVGNLTTYIDIPEIGFTLDLMPAGSETCSLLNIDPQRAYSLVFSFRDSDQTWVDKYVTGCAYITEIDTDSLLDNSYYLYNGMMVDTRPLMLVRDDYRQIGRDPYYLSSLFNFNTILG